MNNYLMTKKRVIEIVAFLLILLIGLIGYIKIHKNSNFPQTNEINMEFKPAKGVEVKVNDTRTVEGKVPPEGLPISLPIRGDIIESYKATYTDMGATQYTVSMNSDTPKAEILKEVRDFLTKNKFTIDEKASNQGAGQISATYGKNTLNIVVTTVNGKSFVQINYLQR